MFLTSSSCGAAKLDSDVFVFDKVCLCLALTCLVTRSCELN